MKTFILAAALLAPLMAVPALAQGAGDAAGYIETAPIQAPSQTREFMDHAGHVRHGSAPVSPAERLQIDRQAVPSSAFSDSAS